MNNNKLKILLVVATLTVVNCLKENLEPLKIIELDTEDGSLNFDKKSLEEVLLKNEVQDRVLCVLSISGGFREGKTFLMNILLRYLRVHYGLGKVDVDWLDPVHGPFVGFPSKAGPESRILSVLMWPEVFLAEIDGEKVAIIVLDTEGGFDPKIFALNGLISSVQMYNLWRNIRQDHVARLQFLAELPEDQKLPFQNIWFLIRDWQWAFEKPLGLEGGRLLLEQALDTDAKQIPQELIIQRRKLKTIFQNISCFLMPSPGETIAGTRIFKGQFEAVDPDFIVNVKILADLLLSRENLVIKQIDGVKVRAKELIVYLEEYVTALTGGGKSVDVKKLFLATSTARQKILNGQSPERDEESHLEESYYHYDELSNFLQNYLNSIKSSASEVEDYHAKLKEDSNHDKLNMFIETVRKAKEGDLEDFLNLVEDEIFGIKIQKLLRYYWSTLLTFVVAITVGLMSILLVYHEPPKSQKIVSTSRSTQTESQIIQVSSRPSARDWRTSTRNSKEGTASATTESSSVNSLKSSEATKDDDEDNEKTFPVDDTVDILEKCYQSKVTNIKSKKEKAQSN